MAQQAAQLLSLAETLAHQAVQQAHALASQAQTFLVNTDLPTVSWDNIVSSVSSAAWQYATANPFPAVVQVLSTILFTYPSAVFILPAAGRLGWVRQGPAPGSLAARLQSYGTPPPFRAVQSAAMGGASGTRTVNRVIRYSSAVTGAVATWFAFSNQPNESSETIVTQAEGMPMTLTDQAGLAELQAEIDEILQSVPAEGNKNEQSHDEI